MSQRSDSGARFLRREFLRTSAGLGGLVLLGQRSSARSAPRPAPARGLVLGPGRRANAAGHQTDHLSLLDLDVLSAPDRDTNGEPPRPREIPLDFFGHGLSPDPTAPARVCVFEKRGPGAAKVDEDYRGLIVVRDGGRTLVVTNGGGQESGGSGGSVTYVDVKSRELIEKVEIQSPALNAGHLALCAARDWMPKETLGGASFRPAGGAMRTMSAPAETTRRMLGESLSLAIHEPTGTVGITNPRGDLVTFWHLRRGELLGELALSGPRGIAPTLDGENFVISYGERTSLLLVDPASRLPVVGSRIPESGMAGSHIVVHDLG